MRRGLIAIRGSAGHAIGCNLIAGTVLVFGSVGIRPGAGMKRGTIGLLGVGPPPAMLPTFRSAGRFRPVFLQIYLRHLRQLGFPIPEDCFTINFERHSGDFLEYGKGEILVRAH
jgi:formylmethanofuran dehydrogenase subunit C